MTTDAKNERFLFQDLRPREQMFHSKAFCLNQERFIELLTAAAQSLDLKQLREQIENLQEYLISTKPDHSGTLLVESSGGTLRVNSQFLMRQLDQIYQSNTLERAVYYSKRLLKSLTQNKSGKINDLNLNRWQEYEDILTDSLWVLNRRDNSGVHTAGYWGNFIPQIPNQMMKRYTKRGDWVLDPFLGCGTTLIECQRLGRNGIGIELQKTVANRARELIAAEPNVHRVVLEVIEGDSTAIEYAPILKQHGLKKVQLIIMHPPYHDIIKFSQDPHDLSNAKTVDEFLKKMGEAVEKAAMVLERNRYLILVIGDKYSKGEWVPLGFLTMEEVLKKGFSLKSIVVKNFEETLGKRNQKELWRYRALAGGFYVFKHEYIFVFKKR